MFLNHFTTYLCIEPKLLHLGYRLSKKTGGGPKPDDDVDEPDPEIFRKSHFLITQFATISA